MKYERRLHQVTSKMISEYDLSGEKLRKLYLATAQAMTRDAVAYKKYVDEIRYLQDEGTTRLDILSTALADEFKTRSSK